MKILHRPQFRLSRVFADGSREDLEVSPIASLSMDIVLDRRELFGVGAAVSTLIAGLSACGPKKMKSTPPPPPSQGTSGPLRAHRTAVSALSLSPDGRTLVTAGINDAIKTWGFPSGDLRSPFAMPPVKSGFRAMLLSPDGQKLATEVQDLLSEIDVKSFPGGNSIETLTGHKAPVLSLSFSPDSRTIFSGSEDMTVKGWSKGGPFVTFEGHTAPVSSVHVSPDGTTVYSGSLDGSVREWSITQRRFLRKLQPVVSPISDTALSHDGKFIAAGSRDGAVHVWSLPDGNLRASSKYHLEPVRSVQISKDNQTIVSGSEDGTVKRWSVKDVTLIDTIAEQIGAITRILLSRDDLLLIVGTALGIAMVWDLVAHRVRTFLFDPSIAPSTVRGRTYSIYDNNLGRTMSYTLPCGSPVPSGATCICNCVPGLQPAEQPAKPVCTCEHVCRCVPECRCEHVCRCVPQQVCTCDKVCTCVPQCICEAVRT